MVGFIDTDDNSGDVNCDYQGQVDVWVVHLIDTNNTNIHDVNARKPIFEVFPNPAYTCVTVHYDMPATTENLSMTMFNGIGREFGTYYLKRDMGTFTLTFRIILSRYIVTDPMSWINGPFILGK